MKITLSTVALVALVACNGAPSSSSGAPSGSSGAAQARSKRAKPVCATQDCATKKIVDDGCAADGQCLSCVNPCP